MLNERGKLLIVDEDDSIRISLSILFSELGYRVRSCEDGISALSEICKEIPDVLLLDLGMSGLPALSFLMVVRRRFPSIRVVVMNRASSGNREGLWIAADAINLKGASPARLIEQVDAMTRPKRSVSRLSIENLFGFQVVEAIPSHPGSEQLPFPANRTIVRLLPRREQPVQSIPFAETTRNQEVHSS
jgi:DNA-binding response OmpR family regulator